MTSEKSHEPAESDDGPWIRSGEAFARWRDGDRGAIDELVREMTPVLWHVVRAYRLDEDVCEDVIQFTWLTLVRKADSVDNPRAVSSWLIITARRQAWRVASRNRREDAVDDELLAPALPSSPAAESEAVSADENHRLWSAVAQLNERCQRLLRVIAFDDRPDYQHISEDLGMPVGSIGPTRRRCLEKLKAVISGEGATS
ncbi:MULTISPECIES: RNA polymerase sigma factor [Aeromicrobium]|uniref:RNA polymerase sigma factor n=1 Tax=Aeromicrobium TaxID=2040 RepID=UPI00257BBA07|nr:MULTISPECIES: sigma-70 family RNA polymerase sigma factor [Aeromicrobium]